MPIRRRPERLPIAAVRAGDRTVGYAFVNADWVDSTGYSGKPIEILVGLGADGKIAGARLMDHHEPIVLVGIPPARIAKFINGYVGRDVLEIAHAGPSGRPDVDIVSGATVTSTVIAESMVRSGDQGRARRRDGGTRDNRRDGGGARDRPGPRGAGDWAGCSATARCGA